MTRRNDTLPGQGETGNGLPVPRPGRTLLTSRPGGMILAIEHYDGDRIAQRDADDRLDDSERRRIVEAVEGRK